MNDTISPFALNLNNLATEEQIQENNIEVKEEKETEELKLDLPVNTESAFETVEVKKKPKVTPEEQAKALLSNYETTHSNIFLSGQQRRTIYRQFLRNAKAGKYEKIFNVI